jgi:hypothetical protein
MEAVALGGPALSLAAVTAGVTALGRSRTIANWKNFG